MCGEEPLILHRVEDNRSPRDCARWRVTECGCRILARQEVLAGIVIEAEELARPAALLITLVPGSDAEVEQERVGISHHLFPESDGLVELALELGLPDEVARGVNRSGSG